jgi:coronin-1B/1C/6
MYVAGEAGAGCYGAADLGLVTIFHPHSPLCARPESTQGNTKYAAVAVQGGGGPFAILPYDKPGRYDRGMPLIAGHTSAVLDFDFNPFHEQVIASGSEDCTIKVWGFPEGGLTETITEPLVDLQGHGRKVTLLQFHPAASNVLASVSSDTSVKLWDIEKGVEMSTLDAHENLIQDIVWDYTGATYATSCKDKSVRICDARGGVVATTIPMAHEGARSSKLTFLGSRDQLVSVGFTRQSQRQFKLWDPRNTSKEVKRVDIDQAAGVILPFFDEDSGLLYLAGKGDGNIRYYEFVDENPFCFSINEYRSTTSAKGMAMVPKRGLNVLQCETARLLKLTNDGIEPLSFIVPRKSDAFQDDLYPPTLAGKPAHTADEWAAGEDKPPVRMSLDPGKRGATVAATVVAKAAPAKKLAKTPVQLNKELESALERITLLEQVIKSNGMRIP